MQNTSNFFLIIMRNGNQQVVSKTLKHIQELLEVQMYLWIQRQHITNLKMIKHFNRTPNAW